MSTLLLLVIISRRYWPLIEISYWKIRNNCVVFTQLGWWGFDLNFSPLEIQTGICTNALYVTPCLLCSNVVYNCVWYPTVSFDLWADLRGHNLSALSSLRCVPAGQSLFCGKSFFHPSVLGTTQHISHPAVSPLLKLKPQSKDDITIFQFSPPHYGFA